VRWPPVSNAEWIERIKARAPANERGCWIWQGSKNGLGYGEAAFRGVRKMVHRFMYELTVGPIPKGMYACHHCDTPSCVNPAHLWIGDHKANQRDMIAKGRHVAQKRTHCLRYGHPLSGDNLAFHEGRRSCRMCQVIRNRVKAGWTEEEALNTPIIPAGQVTARRKFTGRKRRSVTVNGGNGD